MPDILVTELITGPGFDELRRRFEVVEGLDLWREPGRLKELIPGFRALLVRNQTRVTAELIGAARSLRVIGRAGVGVDNLDVAAAAAAGVRIVYTPVQNSNAVAELTLGLMLALARKIPAADRDTKAGGWDRHGFTGDELAGRTLGVIGYGRIGSLVARKSAALGMTIIGHDPYVAADEPKVREAGAELTALDDLLRRADFVSLHVPLTEETRRMLGYEQFCRMKTGAFMLNTARGGVVDEDGLVRALAEKRIAGAALDVRAQEPPGQGNLFAAMENVILTPHIGAFSHEAQERVLTSVCRDVAAVLSGGEPSYPLE